MKPLLLLAALGAAACAPAITHHERTLVHQCAQARNLCDDSHKHNYKQLCLERLEQSYAAAEARGEWLAGHTCNTQVVAKE